MNIIKSPVRLYASPKAVIARFLQFNQERIDHIVKRVLALEETDVELYFEQVMNDFKSRHRNITDIFREHFQRIDDLYPTAPLRVSETKQLLLGALFTMEYSIMAAALFNPSIVAHPDQTGLQNGEQRFIMSLRATGEGHISSIVFQTGIINQAAEIVLDESSLYHTRLLHNKSGQSPSGIDLNTGDPVYELTSGTNIPINEKVIFPTTSSESMGMEDVRFVRFADGQTVRYLGTYTAYNGHKIKTKLIETSDFNSFIIRPLEGAAISDKGMALFPEKINDKYVMISRQGGELIHIMYSNDLYVWESSVVLMEPHFIWEFVQLGNCGSPVKTEQGWLLLIHGVGPMRTYVISAVLLDLQDPSKIIARLDKPLIKADEEEREGYVPNVVYTCGLIRHGNKLIIPYAVSDSATGFVSVDLDELLDEMKPLKY